MKGSFSLDEEKGFGHGFEGFPPGPEEGPKVDEVLEEEDASVSTVGPYEAWIHLDPDELCLASLTGARKDSLCPRAVGCKVSGHKSKRARENPEAGWYMALVEGTKILKVDAFSHLTDQEYQTMKSDADNADREAMEQLGQAYTPADKAEAAVFGQKETEKRGNIPLKISFDASAKKGTAEPFPKDTSEIEALRLQLERSILARDQEREKLSEEVQKLQRQQAQAQVRSDRDQTKVSGDAGSRAPAPGGRAKYYGVAVGREAGVYGSWAEAKAQVEGFPHNRHASFSTLEEAVDYVERYGETGVDTEPIAAPLWRPAAKPVPPPKTTTDSGTGMRGGTTDYEAEEVEKIRKFQERAGLGPDESSGTEGKMFGASIMDGGYLLALLAPRDLPADLGVRVVNCMIDILAFPHASSPDNTAQYSMEQAATYFVALLSDQQKSSVSAPSIKTMAYTSRTALAKVKSADDLRKLRKLLNALKGDPLRAVLTNMTAVFYLKYRDDEVARQRAMQCPPFRILQETMRGYRSLVAHCENLYLDSFGKWALVQQVVDYFVDEINAVRTTYTGGLQIACYLYTLMRDGQSKDWRVDKLLEERVAHLEQELGATTPNPALAPSNKGKVDRCKHCLGVHVGTDGKNYACPYKAMSASKAKKSWNEFCAEHLKDFEDP